jgi:hypothetical protein
VEAMSVSGVARSYGTHKRPSPTGRIVCDRCNDSLPCPREDLIEYRASGFPRCCFVAMRFIPAQTIAAGPTTGAA